MNILRPFDSALRQDSALRSGCLSFFIRVCLVFTPYCLLFLLDLVSPLTSPEMNFGLQSRLTTMFLNSPEMNFGLQSRLTNFAPLSRPPAHFVLPQAGRRAPPLDDGQGLGERKCKQKTDSSQSAMSIIGIYYSVLAGICSIGFLVVAPRDCHKVPKTLRKALPLLRCSVWNNHHL